MEWWDFTTKNETSVVICHTDIQEHDDDLKTFEVITSSLPLRIL
jgi:hypothetical protein